MSEALQDWKSNLCVYQASTWHTRKKDLSDHIDDQFMWAQLSKKDELRWLSRSFLCDSLESLLAHEAREAPQNLSKSEVVAVQRCRDYDAWLC